jgi:hypothetical protein
VRNSVNRWHAAIWEQLKKSGEPLSPEQIWTAMASSGFAHQSKRPRSTLGARIAELVAQGEVQRVGPARYQIVAESAS